MGGPQAGAERGSVGAWASLGRRSGGRLAGRRAGHPAQRL